MKAANPYVYFRGNTQEAFDFYRSVFGGDFLDVVRYRDFPDNGMGVAEGELDQIAHIALPLSRSNMLMGTDIVSGMPGELRTGNNFAIALEAESGEEAETLFGALSSGGDVEMPLQKTEWAEQHGQFTDRYGIAWMVTYTGAVQFSVRG